MEKIRAFFAPKSVVVIGAADKEGSVPRVVINHLLEGKEHRKIYIVGSKEKVYDLPPFASVASLPEVPELAIIITRANAVPDAVQDCASSGVKSIIIISAGFKEIGSEGIQREEKVLEIARQNGIRIMGPNCLGIIRPSAHLNATFYGKIPRPGNVTFLSQSGALGTAVLDWAVSQDIGFSSFVSVGSMADVDFGDLVDYFGADPETKSIIIYMESLGSTLKNARKFMSAVRGFARTKPIVILKPGKFSESNWAAMSHTGSMVGEDAYYDALIDRSGAVRVDEIADLFDCATILNAARLPRDPRLAIVTNAGGPGVLATDALLGRNGNLAKISETTIAELNKTLPATWSKGNPLDILGDATPERFATAIELAIKDPGVGGVMVIYVPQSITPPGVLAKEIIRISANTSRPVLAAMMGGAEVAKARQLLHENRVPVYEFPEQAIKTYVYMYRYARNLEELYETPEDLPIDIGAPKNFLKMMVRNALKNGRTLLNEDESKNLLTSYRIKSTTPHLARTPEEAISLASDRGYPVVMKIASPDISHKSDVGGVILNVCNSEMVKKTFQDMTDNVIKIRPNAKIEGVTIQKMAVGYDYELIVGVKKDPTLGPVIMFGLGGTGAEFYKDVAVGLAPLNQALARKIIQKTRVFKMLSEGFRNKAPVNLLLLDGVLVKVSNLIIDFPEIKELDINPLVVSEGNAIALDARIILDTTVNPDNEGHEHLIISPYPVKYIQNWVTKDGRSLIIRPIRPEDEVMEKDLISGLSKESQRFRFFHPLKDITHEMLTRFCNIDYEREMAFAAEYNAGGKKRLVGVGRLINSPDQESGEFAILTADDFQGVGLGLKLSDMLIGVAREKSLKRMYAITLNDNSRMLNLGKKLGFEIKKRPNSEVELLLELP